MDASRRLAAEYSAKAHSYARHWAPVIAPMALPLLRSLPLADAACVLDVGTGTGALVPALRAAAPSAWLAGVDRSAGMLRLAHRAEHLPCAVMDAQRLGFRGAAFDVALLAFVLFHFPQPAQALSEVHRVLRPGGAAGIVCWGDDPGIPGLDIWAEELAAFGAAPDPRDASVMQDACMNTPDKLAGLLSAADFDVVRAWSASFVHRWTVPALLAVQAGCGSASRRLPSLPRPARAACLRRVRARLARLRGDERVYRPEVVFAVARRR